MDKKKLIGTIIGVTLFAALIAGATFAFLQFTATVTDATYTGGTMNFLVDYTKGDAITSAPQLTNATPESASFLIVKAKKHAGSPNGNLTIKLNTTSTDILTTDGIVNYAICRGACTDNFGAALNQDVVTATGSVNLITEPLSETEVNYYIYFWLDASLITTDHLPTEDNPIEYSGYISATAVQTET